MEIPPLLVHPCQCQMVSIINKMYNVHLLVDINNRWKSCQLFGIIDRKWNQSNKEASGINEIFFNDSLVTFVKCSYSAISISRRSNFTFCATLFSHLEWFAAILLNHLRKILVKYCIFCQSDDGGREIMTDKAEKELELATRSNKNIRLLTSAPGDPRGVDFSKMHTCSRLFASIFWIGPGLASLQLFKTLIPGKYQ